MNSELCESAYVSRSKLKFDDFLVEIKRRKLRQAQVRNRRLQPGAFIPRGTVKGGSHQKRFPGDQAHELAPRHPHAEARRFSPDFLKGNVRGRDVGSFVAEAQKRIAERVKLLQAKHREVELLNDELRRQIAARSRELAEKRMKLFVNNVEQSTYVTATAIAAATFPLSDAMSLVLSAKAGAATASTVDIDWWRIAQLYD